MTPVDDLVAQERETVRCDDNCGAFVQPRTIAEYKAALRHWRYHNVLSGCSHGC